jgi:hypothetical protein
MNNGVGSGSIYMQDDVWKRVAILQVVLDAFCFGARLCLIFRVEPSRGELS